MRDITIIIATRTISIMMIGGIIDMRSVKGIPSSLISRIVRVSSI
jgi:hypothetical protein